MREQVVLLGEDGWSVIGTAPKGQLYGPSASSPDMDAVGIPGQDHFRHALAVAASTITVASSLTWTWPWAPSC
jgi:hypothetical protein